MQEILELFKHGKLSEAIDASNELLKKKPNDIAVRSLLMELLCFNGNFERADKQLDLIAHQSPEMAMTSSLLRLILKGAQARADFYEHGVLPEMFEKDEELESHLSAAIDVKAKEYDKASETLTGIVEKQEPVNITCNDEAVDEFRDLDDLLGRHIEMIGGNGKYYWVHINQITELEFQPPQDRLDLLWRRAEIVLKNGMKGEVRVPTCYIDTPDEASKLAKTTEWQELGGNLVRGMGQRTFLIGENAVPIMNLERIDSVAA